MEKYGFVYIWRDKGKNRYYIGCHWGRENDGYVCSSNWMRMSYKRRPEDFKRKIITKIYTNKEELLEEEYRWLSLIKPEELGNRYYNLRNKKSGKGRNKHIVSKETKEKMRQAKLGKPSPRKGIILSKETKEKISKGKTGHISPRKGVNLTDTTKKLISESLNGREAWNKGLSHSKDTINNISNAMKIYWKKKQGVKFI